MERRVMGNYHARCGTGEKTEITSKSYLSSFFNDEYSAQFFFELWKRARKWGAIPTGITQNVEDLLLSDTARRILSNTEFAIMLNNAASDRQELAHIFGLSNRQLKYITNSSEGQGLIVAGKNTVPFIDKFPADTSIYKVLTTKPEEVNLSGQ